MRKTSYYCILSGASAAAASLLGKLSGLPILQGDLLIVRFILFSLMIVCNGSVWTFYVKALQTTKSSLNVTVLSAAINYFLSAMFGYIVFEELTSLLGWAGLTLILVGIVLITY